MDQRLRDGIAAAHARRPDDARVLLKQAVEACPDLPLAWFWLGVVSPTSEEAVTHLRRALALDASHGPSREALAKLLLAQASRLAATDRPAARALVAEATVLAANVDAVWLAVAALADDRASRLDALRRAHALVPAPATRARLSQALLQDAVQASTADRARARGLFREAATLTPDDDRIWRALVQLAGTPAEALATVRELLALAPAFQEGRSYLRHALLADARSHMESGHRSTACERWLEATTIAPDAVEAWVGVAESTDNPEQAQQALATALSIDPADPRVVAAMARASRAASTEIAALSDAGHEANPWSEFPLNADPFEQAAPAPLSVPAPVERHTVLVVDDSATIRKILSLTLEREGYAVVALSDGESALGRLADVAPHVILLDIAMPGLDGYETCKRIKGDARTAHIPVLMLSGKDGMFDKVKGHMAGATEYLTKPFDASTVVSAIAAACAPAVR